MKISVAVVTSLDGKLTHPREPDIYKWTSAEDQQHFHKLIAEHDVIVMGRGTYEAVQQHLKLDQQKLRVVLTSKPELFAGQAIMDRLEFRNETVEQLVANLEGRGMQSVLVVGGQHMITDFLRAGLVKYIYHTVEPRIFGLGASLTEDAFLDVNLELLESKRLNEIGTLLLVYKILA